MKKISTLILALITFTAFAEKVKISESRENIGGGNNNCLVVTLYEVSVEDAMKEFKSIMKDYDAKVSTKNDELFGDKALIKKISKLEYKVLVEGGIVSKGMIQKLDNAFLAIDKGVKSVVIGHSNELINMGNGNAGTTLIE